MFQGTHRYVQPRMRTAVLLFGFGILVFWFGTGPVTLSAAVPNDAQIVTAIKGRLSGSGIDLKPVTVTSENGIVVLTGTPGNKLARDRTIQIAGTVRGVRSLSTGGLVLADARRADSHIIDDVRSAIGHDKSTENLDLTVNAADGMVTLVGDAGSMFEIDQAVNAAESVPGVRTVICHVQITTPAMRSDSEIRNDIRRRLLADRWLITKSLDVEVNRGAVRLSGPVATGELRTRAVADAWVVGVTAVDDGGLQIDAALADPSLRSGEDVPVPDDDIRTSLIKALTIDPLTRGSRIDPYVANGVVTLFGEASDLPSYRIAGEIAANTLGARWVRNRLEVNVAALPNDRELTNRVAQALVNDPFVDTTTIHVRARSGTAALTGEVQTEFKREHAVALAEAIHGVLTVENKIDVIYEPLRTTDPELRREIEDFLASVTGPSGEDVRLNVRHGIVTLSGSVDSEKTRERIESAAYASGARDVQDLMVIEPMRVAPVRMSGVSDEEP